MVFFLVASFEKGQKFILFVRPHVFARRRQNVQAPRVAGDARRRAHFGMVSNGTFRRRLRHSARREHA